MSLLPNAAGQRNVAVPSFYDGGVEFQEDKSSSFDIRELLAIVWRHRLLIAACVALVLALAVAATMLTTPRYRATASIQIDQESERVLNSQEAQPNAYLDADRFLQTQVDLLHSTALAQRVAQSLGLMGNPKFFAAMGAKLPEDAAPNSLAVRDATVQLIRNNLGVDLPRQSRVASISFVSPDPRLAARVVNAYADGFIEYNLQRKYDSSSYARSFLSKQLASAKARLEESERQLNSYARAAGLIKTGEMAMPNGGVQQSQSVTTASLVQLNQAANEAKAVRIGAEQKWRSASAVPVLSIPEVLTNQAVQELLQQRATLSANLRNEMALHQADYPTVQNLQAQLAEIERQVNTVANGIKSSIHDAYDIARQQENSLESQVASLKGATLAEQDRGVRYGILAREADTNRTLYDGLLQRFKEVSAEAGISSNNISVIDQAEPPSRPSSPRLLLNLALGLIGGIVLAAAAVFVREQMDDAVRVPHDVETKLGLHLLGVIPQVDKNEDIHKLLEQPRTAISEAYHALRTALLYSSTEGLPRTLLLTSTQSGEGKSTTSFAVAMDLARLGQRVVLVDTDMRRPSIHNMIGSANTAGLSSLLTRQCDLAAALTQVPEVPTLSVITAGPIPPSPTELLGSGRMGELLAQLRNSYDAVVLDGPPVLGLADAPIIAAQTDATLFVIEANRGHRGAARTALRRLGAARSKVLGAVLTKFDARKAGMAEYYGYQYYYYGNDDADENKPRRVTAS